MCIRDRYLPTPSKTDTRSIFCPLLSTPACIGPPETKIVGMLIRMAAISIPGTILSQFEIQIRPRSGLAIKNGVTVLNSPGTIDCDYRGEVAVILINSGDQEFKISHGDRIAQMVVAEVVQMKFLLSKDLAETERGATGFGSTGID